MSWDSIVETAMKRYWELLQEFFSTVQWKDLDDGIDRLRKLLWALGVQLLELTYS